MQPLAGTLVVDFTRYLPGPFASRELLQRGARVVRVETPAGDPLRSVAPGWDAALNGGKESVVWDLDRDPDLVRVLVREVTRSSHLQRRIDEIDQAFAGLERIIARGQEEGEFRADVDPRMVSYVFYGALEEILTGWVLGQLDDGDEQIALAEQTVIEVVCGGLVRDREAAPL